MIESLLSEKAEERRALFEEVAGIGLYRDRKTSTERRLEETAADLARLEDLVSEVQTQVRSLARQRGKAERYGKMIEERFGIALTLVRRELEDFDLTLGGLGQHAEQLAAALPGERTRLEEAEREREVGVQARHTAEARRTEVERRLADAKLESGRLEGDLALAAERLRNAGQRRATAAQRRGEEEARAPQAGRGRAAAAGRRAGRERGPPAGRPGPGGPDGLRAKGGRPARGGLGEGGAGHAALAEREGERGGRAPGAEAVLRAGEELGGGVIGLLSDFVRPPRRDAVLAEQLLGEWLHAVLVRDAAAVDAFRRWHEQAHPGPLVLLPSVPGPRLAADGHPLKDDLRVDGPAAAWVHALLAGHEVLEGGEKGGRALRRANGAVFLAGPTAAGGGPLERRAELEALAQEVREAEARRGGAATTLERTLAELAAAEAAFAAAGAAAERARQQELEAGASKDDAERAPAHAHREATEPTAQVERLPAPLGGGGGRPDAPHADPQGHEVARGRLDERLGRERAQLVDLEAQQEAAREQRVRWQVDAAQVEARLGAAPEPGGGRAAGGGEGRPRCR